MKQEKKIGAFIAIEFGLVVLCTLPLFVIQAEVSSLPVLLASVIFMFLPALTTFLVRRLTHDKTDLFLHWNIKTAWKQYLLAAFLPGILIGAGAVLYFLLFPNHLDLSLNYVTQLAALNGQTIEPPQLTIPGVIGIGLILILAAPLVVINHAAAFGEEIGWRGFLLPMLIEKVGVPKAVILSGVLWGLAHAPLVCFGLNYTGKYAGAPLTGILMMVLFAACIGIFLSCLTLKSGSIFPACIAHGAINAVREAPLLICTDTYNALLGPKPSGIIGMAGFLALGAIILVKFTRKRN